MTQDDRCAVLIAADRPTQIARSLSRMVTGAADLTRLGERLKVATHAEVYLDLAANPNLLVELAEREDATLVVVDSAKDVILKPSDEEIVASSYPDRYAYEAKNPDTDASAGPHRPELG